MTGPDRAKGMTARRLLVLASAAYPLGGLATWMAGLLPGLEEAGWEATLALVEGSHGSAAAFLARHPWHRTVTIPNPTGTVLGRRRALAGAIEALAARFGNRLITSQAVREQHAQPPPGCQPSRRTRL